MPRRGGKGAKRGLEGPEESCKRTRAEDGGAAGSGEDLIPDYASESGSDTEYEWFTDSDVEGDEEEVVDGEAKEELMTMEDLQNRDGQSRQILFAPRDEMECDESAYHMLREMSTPAPCLSVDILGDNEGLNRMKYPLSCALIGGTSVSNTALQASSAELIVMQVSQLCKTRPEDELEDEAYGEFGGVDDDNEEDDDWDDDVDPVLHSRAVNHRGDVLKVRCNPHNDSIVASFSEDATVNVFDITKHKQAVMDPKGYAADVAGGGQEATKGLKPLFSSAKGDHTKEGWALDWSPMDEGQLVTGDEAGRILFWTKEEQGSGFQKRCIEGHQGPVLGLEFSPKHSHVFSSCSGDATIRIWDSRASNPQQLCWNGDVDSDINCLSWNPNAGTMLASGGDSGTFKIWDLRMIKSEAQKGTKEFEPIAAFDTHRAIREGTAQMEEGRFFITSLQWSPNNNSLLQVSDDQMVTLWDISAEQDDDREAASQFQLESGAPCPAQLMFTHVVKGCRESRWHKQVPGLIVTTHQSGIQFWRPENFRTLIK